MLQDINTESIKVVYGWKRVKKSKVKPYKFLLAATFVVTVSAFIVALIELIF
ncbi:MAG TPA: hypothetical protein PLZ84_09060 [Clostridia bacterium]|nr:hypothetical protein [Clostridia bacterium]